MADYIPKSEKYAFAECLVWQTTRCLVPQWDFQRLVMYTPRYTDSIQKFCMGSFRLSFYSTFLPTADKVLHRYKGFLQPIVRYQKAIGFEPLELLVFGSFLGFYCAQLHLQGVEDAPDYAVIAVANALQFFDDTDQFHDTDDDGWLRLDFCARQIIRAPAEAVDKLVWNCKMGQRIQLCLSGDLEGRPPVPVWKNSKGEDVLSNNGSRDLQCTTGSQGQRPPPYTHPRPPPNTHPRPPPNTKELKKHGPPPYTTGSQEHRPPPNTNGSQEHRQPPNTNLLKKHGPPPYATGSQEHRPPPNTNGSQEHCPTLNTNGSKEHGPPPYTKGSQEHRPPPYTTGSQEHRPPPNTNGSQEHRPSPNTNGLKEHQAPLSMFTALAHNCPR